MDQLINEAINASHPGIKDFRNKTRESLVDHNLWGAYHQARRYVEAYLRDHQPSAASLADRIKFIFYGVRATWIVY